MAEEKDKISADDYKGQDGIEVPQNYIDMINNNTVSAEMLDAACYSYNKIAKNYRDEGDSYNRDACYSKKDSLLSAVEPICIHEELYELSYETHYSTENDYEYYKSEFTSERTFQNVETGETINVGMIERTEELDEPRFYLFYDFGGEHTYHHPLWDGVDNYLLQKYPVKEIDVLHTHGADTATLLPESFCDKVVELVESGDYTFIPAENLFEKILSNEDVIGERNLNAKIDAWESHGGDLNIEDAPSYQSRVEQFESLPDEIRNAIDNPEFSYAEKNILLNNAGNLTEQDIKDAAEFSHNMSEAYEYVVDEFKNFVTERSGLNYADSVSNDNNFDEDQTKLLEDFSSAGNGYVDAVALLMNAGKTESEVDGILSNDDEVLYTEDQSIVIAEAYKNGMSDKNIDVLKEACGLRHTVDGDSLKTIAEYLYNGGDAEKFESELPYLDRMSNDDTVMHNISNYIIPSAKGKIDTEAMHGIVDIITEKTLQTYSVGQIMDKWIACGAGVEDLAKAVEHIDEKNEETKRACC